MGGDQGVGGGWPSSPRARLPSTRGAARGQRGALQIGRIGNGARKAARARPARGESCVAPTHPRHCAGRGAIPYIHAGVGCARPTSTFFFFFLDWCGREPVAHMPWRPTRPRIVGDSLSKSGVRRSVPRSAPGWQGRASRGGGGGGCGPPFFFLTRGPIKQPCSSGPAVAMAARRM